MNVGQLKKKIATLDDNMDVVSPGFDHTFNKVYIVETMRAEKKDNEYYETYENHDKVEFVLVIE